MLHTKNVSVRCCSLTMTLNRLQEDVNSATMSPELSGLLYRDGRGKSILEQVTANKITTQEAIKMAKLEALQLSADRERAGPEAMKPAARQSTIELDGEPREYEFSSIAPYLFSQIREASAVDPVRKHGL